MTVAKLSPQRTWKPKRTTTTKKNKCLTSNEIHNEMKRKGKKKTNKQKTKQKKIERKWRTIKRNLNQAPEILCWEVWVWVWVSGFGFGFFNEGPPSGWWVGGWVGGGQSRKRPHRIQVDQSQLMGRYRVAMGCVGFDWVWWGCRWLRSSFTGFYRVFLDLTAFPMFRQCSTGLNWVYWVLLCFYWVWLGYIWFYWVSLDYIGFDWVL